MGTCYVIIENVPCYKCEKCGEVFYPASVAEKLKVYWNVLEQLQVRFLFLIIQMRHNSIICK